MLDEQQMAIQPKHNTYVQDTPKESPSQLAIKVSGLAKHYKVGRQIVNSLNDLSLEINEGEFVAITGASGSGKSTLLQLIGGLDKPSQGSVIIDGQDLSHLRDGKLSQFRNKTIGFVFQFFYLQPFLDVQTNIEVPAMFARTKKSVRKSISHVLAEHVGLKDRLEHLPRELSGGQMQRAAIARALQNNPKILLADEPTGNLDSNNARAIFQLLRDINQTEKTTIIVVTHDQELASLADRIITVHDGRLKND